MELKPKICKQLYVDEVRWGPSATLLCVESSNN